MTVALPRTIRAIRTSELLRLEGEAAECGFSQRLSVDWLRRRVAEDAVHYVHPMFEHHLRHRPEVSPHWRCKLLLSMRAGEECLSLLDVRPVAFEALPETLDAAAKAETAARMERALSIREWTRQKQ